MPARGESGRPRADAHEEREGVARSLFAIHTASDYLPRLACAARRVHEGRGGGALFAGMPKLDTVCYNES